MKKTQKILAAALLFTTALSGSAQADTLIEALIQAYQTNPELDAARAAQRAVDEGVIRARTGYFPTVSGTGSITRNDIDDNLSGPFDSTNKFYQARIDQPVFRGFRTASSTKQAGSIVRAGRAQLLSVEQRILLDTVTAYMDVVRDQAVLALNINQVQVLERQLQASQDRFRVGEITRTDVAQSEARLAGAVSQRIQAEANLATSRAGYWRVIGELPGTLEAAPALPLMPVTLDEATAVAIDESPAVNAAVHNEDAARYAVRQAMGALLPTIDGFASISRSEGSFGPFAGDRITTTKAIGAQLRVPLYQAGAEYSDIRRAKQIESQRRLEIIAAQRTAIANARTAWEQYRAAMASIVSSEAQVNANEIALDGVTQEASVGSRTTLDVLDAQQELLDARVNLVRAQRNEYVAAFSLLASMGRMNALSLSLPTELYDAGDYYGDVKFQFVGWGIN